MIKGNFNDPATAFRVTERQIRQPIVYIHPVTSPGTATAIAFTAIRFFCTTTATTHINELNVINNNEEEIIKPISAAANVLAGRYVQVMGILQISIEVICA